MQKLVNLESASSFMKGKYDVGMRFIPRILEKLKGFSEPVQFAVIHLLYFGLFMGAVTTIVCAICAAIVRCH
ncbi:hypothetical protein V0Q12_06725 [Limosilactobacillus reuteri]|uniref:hypothetical protein n=1 Tax=Limosilactobacillus reuteri TaxID=1598 RepID=UPI002E7ADE9A|nr:hypothetical protein [Limosilactobacillus reuteri]MEE1989253.1 hypothetical protein [Limosilactobacillus reuteri]